MSPTPYNGPMQGGQPAMTPDQSGSESFGPSALAGTAPTPDPAQAQQAKLQTAVQTTRGIESDLLTLADSFQSCAPEVRTAVQAVRAVLKKIVSSPGMSEPPAPRTLG